MLLKIARLVSPIRQKTKRHLFTFLIARSILNVMNRTVNSADCIPRSTSAPLRTGIAFPPFEPHPWLKSGHAQTLAGHLLPSRTKAYRARQHLVDLPDGDRIVLHDDCPTDWRPDRPAVLLIHGLAGSHQSPYLRRIASKLEERGIRPFRMDLRGCGAGEGLAKLPYHSGRTEDAVCALEAVARLCPQSPTVLVGFSLGGNITLKLMGEVGARAPGNLVRAMAVCPPVDLAACTEALTRHFNRFYDRYFVNLLLGQLKAREQQLPDAATVTFPRRPRRLIEFDDAFTAPVCGFETAINYYRRCSSAQFLESIALPTMILAARNDPMIPPEPLDLAPRSESVHIHLTPSGGHLGFVSRGGTDPDRRWMDWRVLDWVCSLC